jgi:hypothetical protein
MEARQPHCRHPLKRGNEVAQVLAVAANLVDRMQARMAAMPVDQDKRE